MTQRMIVLGETPRIDWLAGAHAEPVGELNSDLLRRWAPSTLGLRAWELTGSGEPVHWLCAEARNVMMALGWALEQTRLGCLMTQCLPKADGVVMIWDGMEGSVETCANATAFVGVVKRHLTATGEAFGAVNAVWIA